MGVPTDHPSIGRHVREPIEGPSWPQTPDHGGGRMITRGLETLWTVLLAAWILYSRLWFISPLFKDPDAAKIAFGVGQRLQGTPYTEGVFYQIEKQMGSYLIFEWLARLFNVDIAGLEHFLALVCACFMIGILVLTFHLGWMIWGRRIALVSTTILSISPMMWITGQYITSLVPALFFFMLAVWAMVMSYRVKGGRWWLVASGILFAWSAIVRADMILGMLVPICYAHFVDRRGIRRAIILYAIWAVVLLLAWLVIFKFPIAEIFSASQPHTPNYPKSLLLNWWGMGPFLFVFAFAGFVYRFITGRRPLPFIFFWIVGFNTFYTGHLYSGRYFIAYYPVVAWLAAFSTITFYTWLVKMVRYNRPMRLVFMVLFVMGALTMLTTSIIRDGDRGTRIAWADYSAYSWNHGLEPTGSAWFVMQDIKNGERLQYEWIEKAAGEVTLELFTPGAPDYICDELQPIYLGGESQVFLNYQLISTGWHFDGKYGPFLKFTRDDPSDPNGPKHMIQTAYIGNEPVPELAFLSTTNESHVLLGRDALPRLIQQSESTITPTLTGISGWHVGWSFDGLDILVPGETGGASDGSLDVEEELFRFFNRYPHPRYHVDLLNPRQFIPDPEGVGDFSGVGYEYGQGYYGSYVKGITDYSWTCTPDPHQWTALAINRYGMTHNYRLSINGEEITDKIFLEHNIEGFGLSRWEIHLIPPWYFDGESVEFRLESQIPGDLYGIMWTQRNFPDSQYRDDVAIPNELEFTDIEVWR